MHTYRIIRAIDQHALCYSSANGTYWAAVPDTNEVHFGPVGAAYMVVLLNAQGMNTSAQDTQLTVTGDPHV